MYTEKRKRPSKLSESCSPKKKLSSIWNGDHVKDVGEQFLGPNCHQFHFYRNRPSQLNPHRYDLTQITFPLLQI